MSTFESIAADCLAPVLQDCLGELVTWYPSGGGVEYTVKAVVARGQLRPRAALAGKVSDYAIELMIPRADLRVAPVIGGDKVRVKRRITDTTTVLLTVSAILPDGQDGGLWRLGVA